ncbi:MAG: hypothetical protein K6G12_00680 [Lachnospiraceae bacterium]|nr:hypothetical protein [Lachnospiraceae bacterium]
MGQKKRVSNHQGRCGGGSAKHNSRYLKNMDERIHINEEYIKKDILLVNDEGQLRRVPVGTSHFEDAQIEIYKSLYQDWLTEQNRKYHEHRNYKLERTIQDVFYSKRTGPMETILQIGCEGEYEITPAHIRLFTDMVKEYCYQIEKQWPNVKTLAAAIHVSEASLHAHITTTFFAKDQSGHIRPAQEQAFSEMGLQLPHPDQKPGRYNNRLQTFTAEARQLWISIVKQKDPSLEIEVIPEMTKRKHLEKLDYELYSLSEKRKVMEKRIEENQRIIDSQLIAMSNLAESTELEKEISNARQRQKCRIK